MATTDNKSYLDLFLLNVRGGTPVLKELFLKQVQHSSAQGNIETFLSHFKNDLFALKQKGIIKMADYTMLFPRDGKLSILQWDASLFCVVLLCCCTLEGKLFDILMRMLHATVSDVDRYLRNNRDAIAAMNRSGKITHKQFNVLFPSGFKPTDVDKWDCKLCVTILLHVCDNRLLNNSVSLQSFIMREVKLFAPKGLDEFLSCNKRAIDSLKESKQITPAQYLELFPENGVSSNLDKWDNSTMCIIAFRTCRSFSQDVIDAIHTIQSSRKELLERERIAKVDTHAFLYKWTELNCAITTIIAVEVPHVKQKVKEAIETVRNVSKDLLSKDAAIRATKDNDEKDSLQSEVEKHPDIGSYSAATDYDEEDESSESNENYHTCDESSITSSSSEGDCVNDSVHIMSYASSNMDTVLSSEECTVVDSCKIVGSDNALFEEEGTPTHSEDGNADHSVNTTGSVYRPISTKGGKTIPKSARGGHSRSSKMVLTDRTGYARRRPFPAEYETLYHRKPLLRTIDYSAIFSNSGFVTETDRNSLQMMCQWYGRKSPIVRDMCDSICSQIRSHSCSYKHVLAAYKQFRETEIIFLVFTEKGSKNPTRFQAPLDKFNVEFREYGVYSDENKQVMKHLEEKELSFKNNDLNKLENVLKSRSTTLMNDHQNLNIISACPVKCKNYDKNSKCLSVFHETCIVLYVEVKGLIPIQEEIFPKEMDGFPVDIREMGFELYGHKADEYNPKLKMGCLIGCVAEDQINYTGGTLGAFIDLPDGSVGCITSAHVVLNKTAMANLICKKVIDTRDNNGKILQPVPFHGPHFGRVTRAAFNDGSNGEYGLEAAFILIEDPARIPESGEFPEGDFSDIGFSPGNPISYTSGKIYTSVPDETRLSTVYKYGSETLLTRGAFHLRGPSIRTGSVASSTFGFCLQNQIQMVNVGKNDFAKNGDSGALVLVPHKADINDLRAIGIITGGSTDRTLYYVTPIWGILRALGFNDSIKLKCFDDVGTCAMDTNEKPQTVEDQFESIELYGQSVTVEEENHSTTINISKQLETHTNQLREEINDFKEEIKSEQSAVTEQFAEFKSDITNQLTQTKTEMQDVVQKTIDDKLDTFFEKLNKHLP